MHSYIQKSAFAVSVLFALCAAADTHVWKSSGRVNDWNWNEPDNYDSSLGASGVPSAGDIVQLPPSTDIYVNGTDSTSCGIVANLEQVVPVDAGSRIIFNLDIDLPVNCAICSVTNRSAMKSTDTDYWNGAVVKRGSGTLRLNHVFKTGETGVYDPWAYYTGIICEEGILRLQDFETNVSSYPQFYFGHVAVSNNATLFTASCSTKAWPTSNFHGLWGSGVVTNDFTRYRKLSVNGTVADESVFDGKLQGSIRFSSYGRVMLRGIENTHNYEFEVFATGDRLSPWRSSSGTATIGVMKLGNIGEPSTLGPNAHIRYGEYGGNYLYLGTEGETTYKNFQFMSPATGTAGFDAGTTGGIRFKGGFEFPDSSGVAVLRLMGENSYPCSIEGPIPASANCVMFVKEGSGAWKFADDGSYSESRKFFSSMALYGGTLQFDSMEERGWRCSLGVATNTTEIYYGARNDTEHTSPFAYFMGTNTVAGATFEFVGTNGAYATQRQLGLCGKLTMKNHTSHPWRFSGVRPATSGAKTLVLDASTDIANELAGVEDSLANPISIEKTGGGTWTLNGSNTIHGTVAVKNGTLKVRDASGRFKFYRLTIRDSHNSGQSRAMNVGDIALLDKDGKQVNKGLSRCNNYHDISAGQCALMRFGNHSPAAIEKFCNGQADQSYVWVKDGDAAGNMLFNKDNLFSHIPFLMRLADDAAEVRSYDFLLYSNVTSSPGACPGDWSLEGSPDMLHWTFLHEVTAETFPTDISGTDMWVSAKTQATRGAALPETHTGGFELNVSSATIPCTVFSNATVSVAKGATLETTDGIEIKKLILDGSSAGNGTISGFSFAESGDLSIVNLGSESRIEVDLNLIDVTGFSNIANWNVTATRADGSHTRRQVTVTDDGKLIVSRVGYMLIFH